MNEEEREQFWENVDERASEHCRLKWIEANEGTRHRIWNRCRWNGNEQLIKTYIERSERHLICQPQQKKKIFFIFRKIIKIDARRFK